MPDEASLLRCIASSCAIAFGVLPLGGTGFVDRAKSARLMVKSNGSVSCAVKDLVTRSHQTVKAARAKAAGGLCHSQSDSSVLTVFSHV